MKKINDAVHIITTYGRGRIVDNANYGAWFQIDHDKEHLPKLLDAVKVLDGYGMIEYHTTKGNPRNVRIKRNVHDWHCYVQ